MAATPLLMVPHIPAVAAGLVVMELLVPLYWVSNTMVDAHHTQVPASLQHAVGRLQVLLPLPMPRSGGTLQPVYAGRVVCKPHSGCPPVTDL